MWSLIGIHGHGGEQSGGALRTLVLIIVEGAAEDLERARDIKGVVAGVKGEQHLDDLSRTVGGVSNCTHFGRNLGR